MSSLVNHKRKLMFQEEKDQVLLHWQSVGSFQDQPTNCVPHILPRLNKYECWSCPGITSNKERNILSNAFSFEYLQTHDIASTSSCLVTMRLNLVGYVSDRLTRMLNRSTLRITSSSNHLIPQNFGRLTMLVVAWTVFCRWQCKDNWEARCVWTEF